MSRNDCIVSHFPFTPLDDESNEPEPEEWETALEHLADNMRELKKVQADLAFIRSTLLVNFGEVERNKYGFKIKDEGTTFRLLLDVLENLIKEK